MGMPLAPARAAQKPSVRTAGTVCLDPTLHPCPRAALFEFRQALWMRRSRSLAKRRLTTGPGHLWLDPPQARLSRGSCSLFHQPKIRPPASLPPRLLPSLLHPHPRPRCKTEPQPANPPSESPMPCFEIGMSVMARRPRCCPPSTACDLRASRSEHVPTVYPTTPADSTPTTQAQQPETRWKTPRGLQGKLPPHPAALAFSGCAPGPLARRCS